MRWLTSAVALLVASLAVTGVAHAQQTHHVTVAVQQSTYDDFKAMTDWIKSAPEGASVPEAISRRGTAAMAEIVAAAEKRVVQASWLTLDSGLTVFVADGDTVQVASYVSDVPSTVGVVPVVVINKGQGFALTLERKDLLVPSRL